MKQKGGIKMETKITVHPKNASYNQITNATPEMIALASDLAKGNWAKVTGTSIVVHVNHVRRFQLMLQKPAKAVNSNVCSHCGATLDVAPDGSKFCSKCWDE